jgi:hypothetical protein
MDKEYSVNDLSMDHIKNPYEYATKKDPMVFAPFKKCPKIGPY